MPDELKKYEQFKHGSTWLKVDFHLHARSDKQFKFTCDDNSAKDRLKG